MLSVLFLNKKLHAFGKNHLLCVLFVIYTNECNRVKCSWSDLVKCFQKNLNLTTLTPQLKS